MKTRSQLNVSCHVICMASDTDCRMELQVDSECQILGKCGRALFASRDDA